ncbi:MAG: manganese efflux pump MntP family protein [Kiritimatiellae bacterium]|nr:manganese efflux pump MntP family protein [Kiritimatiellia bacterium]MDD4736815.1 manganese efflux pump MntP family protein [Kiritimatiellia bacterium]
MTWWSILVLAVGLALDAFAVSVSSGIAIRQMRLRHAMLIAIFFGVFQAIMPILGWACGFFTRGFLGKYDHFIAFGLLTFIGGKMIVDAFRHEEEKTFNPLDIYVLFALAVATSIDAFAVGITLSLLDIHIITPACIIGLITFVLSLAGVYIGDFFGHLFENKLEIAGGLILIGIGTKILIQHVFFHP